MLLVFGVIGLGNPGKQYVYTRHNVGFRVTELVAGTGAAWKTHGGSRIARVTVGRADVLLIQPQTFMNRSGEAARPVLDFFRVKTSELIVVYDDLDLEPGVLRLRQGGSAGGHRGVEDLLQHLPDDKFYRVKVGIGHPRRRAADEPESRVDVPNYVLGAPRGDERAKLEQSEAKAAQAVEVLIAEGLGAAQQRFHLDG